MSMAIKYGLMKRAQKMAMGGNCSEHDMTNCEMCHGGYMAEGGFVGEEEESGYQDMPMPKAEDEDGDMDGDMDDDMIGRIMKSRYAKGGMVKGEPTADFEMNDFDALDEMDPGTKADETGANSGDEVGDAQEDEDRRDIVSRIMRSRSKKDRMPRPA